MIHEKSPSTKEDLSTTIRESWYQFNYNKIKYFEMNQDSVPAKG